jgi:DNA-binding transcriptional ArsR family regulator
MDSVADNFRVSRTAIYKHFKILTECGLLAIKQQGRKRYCEVSPKELNEVAVWVHQYRNTWNKRLL